MWTGDLHGHSEFQGVANQVGQNLPQTPGITAQPGWDVQLDRAGQLNAFSEGALGQQVQSAFDRFDQVKIENFEQKFACFDLRKIQDVIDDGQERIGTGSDRFGKLALTRVQCRRRVTNRSCQSRRSSECGSRGSCWPGIRSSPWRSPPPPPWPSSLR
jgi:hypothetical protein